MKRLSIIVPYRDRLEHLRIFRRDIESYMIEKGIPYNLYVIEQETGKPFNRGKLLNIGFHVSKDECDYFCFHDVDMIPIEANYSPVESPTHIAVSVEQFEWKLPYEGYFGGVTLFDKNSFIKINGYSNEYWGWGAEDDDLLLRCKKAGIETLRRPCSFRSLPHIRGFNTSEYEKNFENLRSFTNSSKSLSEESGLTNLHYDVISSSVSRIGEKDLQIKVRI